MAGESAKEITVSVLITTYKHEAYIAECLESVLRQITDFRYEILVGVDDGGDKTLEICKRYESMYPEKLKVVLNDATNVLTIKNQRVGRYNFLNILKRAKGKFIARLDGDDYWTNNHKLQRQVDFLNQHPECAVCHAWHEYAFPMPDGFVVKPAPTVGQGYWPEKIAGLSELFSNKLRIKTRTILFKNIGSDLPEWFHKIKFGDVALSMILGGHGKFGFINEPMAVYRMTHTGSSRQGQQDPLFVFQQNIEWIRIWEYGMRSYSPQYDREAMQTIFYFYRVIFSAYRFNRKVLRMCREFLKNESVLSQDHKSKVDSSLFWLWLKSGFVKPEVK